MKVSGFVAIEVAVEVRLSGSVGASMRVRLRAGVRSPTYERQLARPEATMPLSFPI